MCVFAHASLCLIQMVSIRLVSTWTVRHDPRWCSSSRASDVWLVERSMGIISLNSFNDMNQIHFDFIRLGSQWLEHLHKICISEVRWNSFYLIKKLLRLESEGRLALAYCRSDIHSVSSGCGPLTQPL